MGVTHLADVDRRRRLGVGDQLRAFEGSEQFAEVRVGGLLVIEAGEQGLLFGAMPDTTERHVRQLVPAEQLRAG